MKYEQLKKKAEALYAEMGGVGRAEARVIRALVEQCEKYRRHIERETELFDACNYDVLGKMCVGCKCWRGGNGRQGAHIDGIQQQEPRQ